MSAKPSNRTLAMLIGVLGLLAAVYWVSRDGANSGARRNAPWRNSSNPFAVPEGGVHELTAFLRDLAELQREAPDLFAKQPDLASAALIETGERILAKQPDDGAKTMAVKAVLAGLALQIEKDDAPALVKLRQVVETWRSSEIPEISTEIGYYDLRLRELDFPEDDPIAAKALVEDTATLLTRNVNDRRLWTEAIKIATMLGQSAQIDNARLAFSTFSATLSQADNREAQRMASQMQDSLKKLDLVGQELDITGATLDGQEIDWASYRGKIVLVDFWATWCGPCVQDLPHLKKNYDLFHKHGFDVVGVCLDEFNDKADVQSFVKQHQLPWAMLFGKSSDEAGTSLPLARKYEIRLIPTAILVDQEGKVITPLARGASLGPLLAKRLGVELPPEAKPGSPSP